MLVKARIETIVEQRVSELESYIENLVENRLTGIINECVKDIIETKADSKDIADTEFNDEIDETGQIEEISQDGSLATQARSSISKRGSTSKRFVVDGEPYPGGIGFTACVSVSDLENLGDSHVILFDRIITNTGNYYHNDTGIFLAPLKGLYVFHLSSMSNSHKSQYLEFMKDGVKVNQVYPDADNSADYGSSSNLWVMQLEAGSEIWIQTYRTGQIHGNCFTVFSGFLLNEFE